MKNFKFTIIGIIFTLILTGVFIGCDNSQKATITFKSEGHSDIVKHVTIGEELSDIPQVPEKEGHTGNWDVTDFSNITKDLVVNAVYTANTMIITFKVEGMDDIIKVALYGSSLTSLPQVPEKLGYVGTWDIDDFSNIKEDLTVTAVYVKKTHTVTFKAEGLDDIIKSVPHNASLNDIPAIPEKDGYTVRWSVTDFDKITASIIVDAIYYKNYTVTYDYQDATVNNTIASSTVALGLDEALVVPSSEHYTFGGWYTEIGGVGKKLADSSGRILGNWDTPNELTAHAYWTGTVNLQYNELKTNGVLSSYSALKGIANTNSKVVIPPYYKGLPVTAIGFNGFEQCNFSEIILPKTLLKIEENAFRYCGNLADITIPESVSHIGKDAFWNTPIWNNSLYNNIIYADKWALYSPNELAYSISLRTDTIGIAAYAFATFPNLGSVTVPNSVKYIGFRAFADCPNLASFTFPQNLVELGYGVFFNSSILSSISEIPASTTSIIGEPFYGCTSLLEIDVNANNTVFASEDGVLFDKDKTKLICYPAGKNDFDYSVPSSVTEIGYQAFFLNRNIQNVFIPSSVEVIRDRPFTLCSDLMSITVDAQNEFFCSDDGIMFSYDKTTLLCYPSNKSGSHYEIPDSVTTLAVNAIYGSRHLTSVIIPDSVTFLRFRCFGSSTLITSIIIPASVVETGADLFNNWNSNQSIYIVGGEETTSTWSPTWAYNCEAGIYEYYGD